METTSLNEFQVTILSLRLHQRQLLEQTQGGCPNLPRPTQLDVKSHSPSHALPQGAARDERKICPPEPAPAAVPSVQNTGMRAADPVDFIGFVCNYSKCIFI